MGHMAKILVITSHSIFSLYSSFSLLVTAALWFVLANEMEVEVACVTSIAKTFQIFSCLFSPVVVIEETKNFRKFSYKMLESPNSPDPTCLLGAEHCPPAWGELCNWEIVVGLGEATEIGGLLSLECYKDNLNSCTRSELFKPSYLMK